MQIGKIIAGIRETDKKACDACIARFDQVAKPVGSLGELETLLARVAAIKGTHELEREKKAVLVFCADNGVVAQGVTQAGSEVTTAVARVLAAGRASVATMAKACGAEVFPIDIGMVDTVDGLDDKKLMVGTADITKGPAMTPEIMEKAVMTGVDYIREMRDKGFTIVATGETGMGNTTTSSAMTSVLLGASPEEVTGRGAGLGDDGLRRKIEAVRLAVEINKPDASDPLEVLTKLGGLDIAAMTGMFLGGALYRVPIVMDGFISGVAALVAVRLCSHVREYILPSHESAEPGAHMVMEALGFKPVLHAGMRLGEGTGAVALFPLLDMALDVYKDAATFADIAVDQYKRNP